MMDAIVPVTDQAKLAIEEYTLLASDIRDPAFCAAWRSRADVRQRVLGTGIAAMDVQRLSPQEGGRTLLSISLTWASDLADGPDEASVLLDVLVRPDEEA